MSFFVKNIRYCILFVFLWGCESEYNYSERLTSSTILELDIGMSENQVVNLLGNPVRKYSRDFQSLTYEYTEKMNYNYPMVWVHFDSLGVKEVYVKYYGLIDDEGVYGLSRNDENNRKQWGKDMLKNIIK